MIKTWITLPDGRQISSGAPGAAVVSSRLVRKVNTGKDITPGAVCPAELTCRLTEAAEVTLTPGDWVHMYYASGQQRRVQGVFKVTEVTQKGRHTLSFTARDPLCLLEQDLTQWLNTLTGWPYTLKELAVMVCQQCGLTLAQADFYNGGFPVEQFAVSGVTGKDILSWIGELTCSFFYADAFGRVVFSWYQSTDLTLTPDQSGSHWYYRDSLTLGAAVEKIDCVRLKPTAAAPGVCYPEVAADANAFTVAGSFLLAGMNPDYISLMAQTLYTRLQHTEYVPCHVTVAATDEIQPGQILSVTDCRGQSHITYVMQTVTENGKTRIISTGAARRDNSGLQHTMDTFRGKVLQLQSGIDWLRAESADAEGHRAYVELELEKIRSRVQQQETDGSTLKERMSTIEQTASSVDIAVKTLQTDGVDRVVTKSGYSFTDEGLIISRQGEQMKNLLDHTGMYVTRGGETILQANHAGVEATDVTVRNYLIVGDHARFEDYGNGTACFYI